MAPIGLLDQQLTALTTVAAARAAAAQRILPLVQERVGFAPSVVPLVLGTVEGSIFTESVRWMAEGPTFFDAGLRDLPLTVGSTTRPASEHYVRPPLLSTTMRQQDLVSRVTAVRDLIQKEQISAARRLLEVMPVGASEEPAINRLRRALTPPIVRPSGRKDTDRRNAYEWLRQHGHRYKGQWVAVGEGGLIASAPTLKALREQVRALAAPQDPLFHKL